MQDMGSALDSLAATLRENPEIMLALVKPWGPDKGPVLVVVPKEHRRHTTRRLRAIVARIAPGRTFATLRPQPVLGRVRGQRRVVGFSAPYWKFVFDADRSPVASLP